MKTFEKILIANRGEIALRVIRAARSLGILTVAVYAEDDADSLHVAGADEAFLLNGKTLKDTYLNQQKIIQIAVSCKAQAIHPGYGFLAENADFASKVSKAGIVFIGPSPENIRLMGEKNRALSFVDSLGIPILPSFRGTKESLLERMLEIDFPVMVKASGGGGGKGMVICNNMEELEPALEMAERQALSYFGNGELFIEKYLPRARHVEVQLMADQWGNMVHFYERECSVQRHFQKIIEEAPSPSVDPQLREELTATALKIAQSMGYRNAGTIEYLLDEKGGYYFLEMNTRIQVEHPVTEMVTHTDLVALQIMIAAGNPLPFEQKDIKLRGHAIEVRLCAEDTTRDFLPSAGKLTRWTIPTNKAVRVETSVTQGKTISPNYDSLLAKIIVKGDSRLKAIKEMQVVLSQSYLSGVHTNLAFLSEIISGELFRKNKIYTRYIDEHLAAINSAVLQKREQTDKHLLVAAYLVYHFYDQPDTTGSVFNQIGYWRISPRINVSLEGSVYDCRMQENKESRGILINGNHYELSEWQKKDYRLETTVNGKIHMFHCMEENGHTNIHYGGHSFELQSNDLLQQAVIKRQDQQQVKVFQNLICAELFGKIIKLSVMEGEVVKPHQVLLTLESMKTEIHVLSPVSARVRKVHVKESQAVAERQLLLELEAIESREASKAGEVHKILIT